MLLSKFEYNGAVYIVQSYLPNQFINICELDGCDFKISLFDNSITTTGKETDAWKTKAKSMLIPQIIEIVSALNLKYTVR